MSCPDRGRGYALIECLVLITVMGVILTLCAGTIHLLLKLDRAGRDASEEAVDLARLARDFRDDAHAAPRADPPGRSADRIVLSMEGPRAVEYAIRAGDVLRTVRDGEKVRKFETYRRPARASARIDLVRDGPRPIAALIFDRPPGDRESWPFRDYRIEAELGKHRSPTPRQE